MLSNHSFFLEGRMWWSLQSCLPTAHTTWVLLICKKSHFLSTWELWRRSDTEDTNGQNQDCAQQWHLNSFSQQVRWCLPKSALGHWRVVVRLSSNEKVKYWLSGKILVWRFSSHISGYNAGQVEVRKTDKQAAYRKILIGSKLLMLLMLSTTRRKTVDKNMADCHDSVRKVLSGPIGKLGTGAWACIKMSDD